jgi:hypothetical protein
MPYVSTASTITLDLLHFLPVTCWLVVFRSPRCRVNSRLGRLICLAHHFATRIRVSRRTTQRDPQACKSVQIFCLDTRCADDPGTYLSNILRVIRHETCYILALTCFGSTLDCFKRKQGSSMCSCRFGMAVECLVVDRMFEMAI